MPDRFAALEIAIREGQVDAGVEEALRVVRGGISPLEVFSECIEPTLNLVGEQFSRLEIFLPEMVKSASVVKAVQEALTPYLEGDRARASKGKVVICTILGDLHDIGKNIVKAMLEVNGFEVRDLGVDVRPGDAIRAAVEYEADIIALSALMLPTLPYAQDVIDLVKGNEKYQDRFKVMVGGGPVSRQWAEEAGADGYGDDAAEAVQVAQALLSTPA